MFVFVAAPSERHGLKTKRVISYSRRLRKIIKHTKLVTFIPGSRDKDYLEDLQLEELLGQRDKKEEGEKEVEDKEKEVEREKEQMKEEV